MRQLPAGFAYESSERSSEQVEFLADLTWVDNEGRRHVQQSIFDEVFSIIGKARRFILIDMFLYNDFQGKKPETQRALSAELTSRLLEQKKSYPDLQVTLISDPINTVYGGIASEHFESLEDAGIQVVLTDLDQLPDSNPCYSLPWRVVGKPFGTARGGVMPNPFGDGRVSLRSWLKMLNFKANHRKVIVADEGHQLVGMVTSANPHDGSSAHRNTAVKFTGAAAFDLLESEIPVLEMSGAPVPVFDTSELERQDESGAYRVRVLTESRIREAVLRLMNAAGPGDQIDLVMFYLSERKIIRALMSARERGAAVRVLLDPNKDAFGWKKNGIPNRQVARELVAKDVNVRWCDTHGEQCHGKTLIISMSDGTSHVITGSANYTRRNLDDLNLETDVWISADDDSEFIRAARGYFDRVWSNEADRQYSVAYEVYADRSFLKRFVYRFQEATGLSSF